MIINNLDAAIEALNNEKVIGIPTETVYGLAANGLSDKAIKQIFKLKKRPLNNPLILHIASIDRLSDVAEEIPELAFKLARKFWPGPLTLVLKRKAHISDLVTAQKETVAVRVPNHPVTLDLLNRLSFPLAAPSANPFTSISPTSAEQVHTYFQEELDIILQGGICEKGIESTIIGFSEGFPVLFRHGSITIEEIEKVTGQIKIASSNNKNPEAPGMFTKHYSPNTDLYLTENLHETINSYPGKKIGLLIFTQIENLTGDLAVEILSYTGALDEAAKNLYSTMQKLDSLNLDLIIAERLPNYGLGKSINDRLERAAKK
jgi:L-threonylcarbamoyladenylate synthase